MARPPVHHSVRPMTRSLALLAVALVSLSGCAALAEIDFEQVIDDIIVTPDEQVEAAPPPETLEPAPPVAQTVESEARSRSANAVTPSMLAVAEPIARRLRSEVGSANDKQAAIERFQLTSAEKDDAKSEGFRTITIEVGGGAAKGVGASLSQGFAFDLQGGGPPRAVTGGGFVISTPGVGADLRLGFWKASIGDLAGWSLGVNGNAISPKGVGVGVGVFWSVGAPPQFEGFSVGASFGKPGGGADAGLSWTEYTQQIMNTASDTGTVLIGGETQHGAEIGDSCRVGPDCRGYNSPVGARKAGVACCSGTCQRTKKDYAGISWCPAVCKSGLFAPPGSC